MVQPVHRPVPRPAKRKKTFSMAGVAAQKPGLLLPPLAWRTTVRARGETTRRSWLTNMASTRVGLVMS